MFTSHIICSTVTVAFLQTYFSGSDFLSNYVISENQITKEVMMKINAQTSKQKI